VEEPMRLEKYVDCCCSVKINKPYKRGRGANYNYAILCSNGGGRVKIHLDIYLKTKSQQKDLIMDLLQE
jgi:hypothetical protein